jgi:hypothetical protein
MIMCELTVSFTDYKIVHYTLLIYYYYYFYFYFYFYYQIKVLMCPKFETDSIT